MFIICGWALIIGLSYPIAALLVYPLFKIADKNLTIREYLKKI